jgi:Tfp pilus assembly protein PilF
MTTAFDRRHSFSVLARVVMIPLMLSLVLGAAPRPAAAAPDDEAEAEARKRFRRGTKLFDEGKFREAAHEFESGYAVLPRTGFLLNIGHSYRRSGDLKKAKRYYEMFLQQETESPRQRAEAAEYVRLVDEQLAEQAGDEPPDYVPISKEKLAAKNPSDGGAPLSFSNEELERLCQSRPPKREVLPWVVAGVAALIAAGLGGALLLTNRDK